MIAGVVWSSVGMAGGVVQRGTWSSSSMCEAVAPLHGVGVLPWRLSLFLFEKRASATVTAECSLML